ncbi:glycosyl transferase [Halteromyces radiatus]|uniref:glycosyl transferase n=1 Tax=Halteromyces radiatus TaxID=101107 RepID=UPI00221F3234|nr:glycosyl transferase [Halteromyces radiatus]KAI8098924.1 glycosyl transferase [Halteromyces radiatus]
MSTNKSRPTPRRRLFSPNVSSQRMMEVVIHGNIPAVQPSDIPTRTNKHPALEDQVLERWKSLTPHPLTDPEYIEKNIVYHTTYTLGRHRYNVDKAAMYHATAHSVRDLLLEEWNTAQEKLHVINPKRCYYLSMEFLLGRALDNALYCLSTKKNYTTSIKQLGFSMEDLLEQENDAALASGGLGRLAACYMDSATTLNYPVWGYGLRFQYGIFKQIINKEGFQVEAPDYWLGLDNPWEIPREDIKYDVQFYGYVATKMNDAGESKLSWEGGETVQAMAYDMPIPGYGTNNCGNIRLWESQPQNLFDFGAFNNGDYDKAVNEQKRAANLTAVLYPNDNHASGKELRLKQEYFWVSASLQDIIRRFKRSKRPWKEFSDQVALQLNDTHPVMAIIELQRLFVDVEGLPWDTAWDLVTKTFAFTNHTVLPEALERWEVPMMTHLLPRHMQIIYDINLFFLQKVEKQFPGDRDILNRMSIIEESNPQQVRMAYLAVIGSHKVNCVAMLHTELVKKDIFPDFVRYFGEDKFINITNGITPRRWLYQANPSLRDLITETLGSEKWVFHLDELAKLKTHADDKQFQKRWMNVKLQNKQRLASWISTNLDIQVSPDALFDIQVKRIHEYKRQFLNILGVIYRYRELIDMDKSERSKLVPRVVIFGGKAAPGYYVAKLVIKLINSVAQVVNNDESIDGLLKVVFIPDYKVSLAEIIIPASDISQHISTAGTEASGTSNMKFVLNGGLILGTVDGANIEIRDEIGQDNIFMFGTLADKVSDLRHHQKFYGVLIDANLQGVLDFIESGVFGEASIFNPLIDTLTYGGDYYLISQDFDDYLNAQDKVDQTFRDKSLWAKKSILCTSGMGFFSSDRAIRDYADKIWDIKPME